MVSERFDAVERAHATHLEGGAVLDEKTDTLVELLEITIEDVVAPDLNDQLALELLNF
jgi:hypothetical protein